MPQKWGQGRWGTFRWAGSNEFQRLLDQKTGVTVKRKLTLELDEGDVDLTAYLKSASAVYQEKERSPDRLAAGDCTITLRNTNQAFCENVSTSLIYGKIYHNKNIVLQVGVDLSNGTTEYLTVATMKVRSLRVSTDGATATMRVYDQVRRLLTETVNRLPSTMVAAAGGSNVGNGKFSEVDVKPFVNVAQNWTVTCTLGGDDGVATFSVVGSVSGNIGTATSGTEFRNATTGGIQFTVSAGDVDWVIGDVFTFTTVKMMEFDTVNPVKIMWSILTGTNFDTGSAEAWQDRTPQLNSTRNSTNPDLNYDAFSAAADIVDMPLKGFIPWDYDLTRALEELVMHFLGSLNVDQAGRLYVKAYRPELTTVRVFADTKKNSALAVVRDTQDMVNWVNVKYRATDAWPWSNENEDETLDGVYVSKSQDSYDDYGQWFTLNLKSRWYNASADHVTYCATRLVEKYRVPPRKFEWRTGLDGIQEEVGSVVAVTDSVQNFEDYPVEVIRKEGDYTAKPVKVFFEGEDTGTVGTDWAFLGSTADEGDGESPQASSFLTATDADKRFCYLSQTGGSGGGGPDYYLFGALLCAARLMATLST